MEFWKKKILKSSSGLGFRDQWVRVCIFIPLLWSVKALKRVCIFIPLRLQPVETEEEEEKEDEDEEDDNVVNADEPMANVP